MNNLLRLRILITALSLALIFSAFLPGIASADEGEPPATEEPAPPPDDGGEAELAADDPTQTEPAILEESVVSEPTATEGPTEAAPLVEETVTEVLPTEGEPTESLPTESEVGSSADPLEGLPEGTDVIVVNQEGEILPLASEEAAEAIIYGDPIWCPSGVSPKPGLGGCSASATSIDQLVSYYPNGFPSNGTIWVQAGPAVGGIIDGSGAWAAKSIYSITIQGGWAGTSGSTALNTADPYSYFDGASTGYISIVNWIGAITLKHLDFNGDGNYPLENAINVETMGNITLDKVVVSDGDNFVAHVDGAVLDNSGGTGNVTVTNSSFNDMAGWGLVINSRGAITLKNVYAFENSNTGVKINNVSALSAKTVSIVNSEFSRNAGDGLLIDAKGTVTLNNVVAIANSSDGVSINNTYLEPYPVSMLGVNNFSSNWSGINVQSRGAIILSKTTAMNNGSDGAHLDNSGAAGYQPITIAGFFTGIGNGGDGLEILSRGNLTAAYLTANDNGHNFSGGNGVTINNWTLSGTPHLVMITGKNNFSNNGFSGLAITSKGAITLNNLSVTYNGQISGVYLNNQSTNPSNQQPVMVNGTNLFTNNGSSGIFIQSFGAVTLNNITSLSNTDAGAYIINTGGTSPKAVSVKGTNIFNNNISEGLYVQSDGAITVYNITASKNKEGGAFLDNCSWNGSTCAVTFQSTVTITGYGVFEYNGKLNGAHDGVAGTSQVGLEIRSRGTITLYNISANHNYGSGAEITTTGLTAVHSVTLNGINTFNNNGDLIGFYNSGLGINADGAIKVNKVTASDNFLYGVWLNNRYDAAIQMPVTVSGYSFLADNGWDGMNVYSFGVVTLSNFTAVYNQTGLYLVNTAGTYPKSVLINGTNTFNNNRDYGLFVFTDGAIAISNVTASRNKNVGAYLDNDNSASAQFNVNISGYGLFEYNGKLNGDHTEAAGPIQIGLQILSHGAITLYNVSANHNYGSGAEVTTGGITTVHSVALNGTNTFNFNGDATGAYNAGLHVDADGAITVNKLTASDNYSNGVLLNNQHNATLQPAVTVNGFSFSSGNGWDGLIVWSYGAVTLNNVTSLSNAGSGAWIVNNGGTLPKAVILKGTNTFNNNSGDFGSGLVVTTDGAITLSNITASRNKNVGAWLDNCGWNGSSCTNTAQSNVVITGYGLFEYNGKLNGDPGGTAGSTQAGLAIHSHGAVTLAYITANHNYGTGADVYTIGLSAPKAVTLTGVNTFTFNGDAAEESGLLVNADGNITITNLTASYNWFHGADLDNRTNWDSQETPFITFGSVIVNGFGHFVGNLTGAGILAETHGAITLNRIVADMNVVGMALEADSNITLVCSSSYGNTNLNVYASAGGTLTLKGLVSFFGTYADILYPVPVQGSCP